MITVFDRAIFWAPRALSILFIAFVSLFALDVFDEGRGFWQTIAALTMHLIPTFVLLATLVVAWRWEWLGTAIFSVWGIFFLVIVRGPWWTKTLFAVPCFLTAGLFLFNWRKKQRPQKAAN